MSLFFNGRTWVSPAVVSAIDDSLMYGSRPSDGNNLAIIGRSNGGEPNKALSFGSASEARSVLRGGDLLRAVERSFDASPQSQGPSKVTVVRVNPATQSSLMLVDSVGGDAIHLKSTNFGLIDNQVKVKVETGTSDGLRLTTQFGTSYRSIDNVARAALLVTYSGVGPGIMTINNTTVTITLNAVETAIDLASFPTVQQLVDRLNAVTGITAEVQDNNGEKPTLNGLDDASGQDIKTATYVVMATLQAAIDWFNSVGEDFVTATRPATATKVPVNVNFTYLAGGSDGSVTNSEWTNAFTALQTSDVQWVVPLSSSASIHAMASAHVSYMSDIARQERRSIVGTASGTSDSEAILSAKLLNNDRVSLTHLGVYDYDVNGKLTMFEPFIAAVMIAAAFAGLNPGSPMTNKALKIRGLERKLRNPTDTDDLITGGVLCLEDTANGYKVVKSVSTWLINDNFNRREVSVGVGLDFTMRKVRATLDELRGSKNDALTLSLAVSRVDTVLRALSVAEPAGPGVLAGDASSPGYRNIVATQVGDVLRVEFQASPVLPLNYIPVICYSVPYSGSSTSL